MLTKAKIDFIFSLYQLLIKGHIRSYRFKIDKDIFNTFL